MNGQPFYYQHPHVMSLPDPFLYTDFTSGSVQEYTHLSYWDDISMDDDDGSNTPTSVGEALVNDMSGYVEYGDEWCKAGPVSFPSYETYPSTQQLLAAQAMVQTVNPADLLLSNQATRATETTATASRGFAHALGVGFGLHKPMAYQAPVQQQVSDDGEEMDVVDWEQQTDVQPSTALHLPPQDAPHTNARPSGTHHTGQVILVDADGEEFEAWTFETILDSRRVANCKGGIEYLVQWTGYSPSWQPARDLRENVDEIVEFHGRMPGKFGPPKWALGAMAQ